MKYDVFGVVYNNLIPADFSAWMKYVYNAVI